MKTGLKFWGEKTLSTLANLEIDENAFCICKQFDLNVFGYV